MRRAALDASNQQRLVGSWNDEIGVSTARGVEGRGPDVGRLLSNARRAIAVVHGTPGSGGFSRSRPAFEFVDGSGAGLVAKGMNREPVTIVFVPRERFSATLASLESIYRHTDQPFELVCVDGGSPPEVRDAIRAASERFGFSVVRTERVLAPNEARNLGAKHATDSEFLLFIDNDVTVSEGWLDRLFVCAAETGADIVGPLYMIGEPGSDRIHMAGGEVSFPESDQGRGFLERHRHSHTPRAQAGPLHREAVDFVEFHCMLVKAEVFRAVGGLDEELLSMCEHTDFCLAAARTGAVTYFEPASVVTYSPPRRFQRGDRSFFLLRWSDDWNRRSAERFAAKWGVEDRTSLDDTVRWAGRHRRKAFHKPLRRFAPLLEAWLTRGVRGARAGAHRD